MELEDLPLEQFYNFCESLDIKELSKLSQTSKENYLICKKILAKRAKEVSDEIVKELVGHWYHKEVDRLMMTGAFGVRIPLRRVKRILITADSESITVASREDANIKTEIISRKDINQLNSLLKYIKRNYVRGNYETMLGIRNI